MDDCHFSGGYLHKVKPLLTTPHVIS